MSPADPAQQRTALEAVGETRSSPPAWPGDSVPTAAEAESAVAAVLAGTAGGLDPELAGRVRGDLTAVERAAFAPGAQQDAQAFRSAAAMRWRFAAAVLTAPRSGSRFDADAAAALLADADGVLAELERMGSGAPEALAGAISTIRVGLVREALALGNVVQRLATAAEQAAPGSTKAVKAVQARILSMAAGDESATEPKRGSKKMWLVLAIAVVLAGGFHLSSALNRPPRPPRPDGAPADAIAAIGKSGRSVVATRDGKPLQEAELSALRAAQKARGNDVVEIAPGVYEVAPPRSAPPAR